jgi:cytochrome c553
VAAIASGRARDHHRSTARARENAMTPTLAARHHVGTMTAASVAAACAICHEAAGHHVGTMTAASVAAACAICHEAAGHDRGRRIVGHRRILRTVGLDHHGH